MKKPYVKLSTEEIEMITGCSILKGSLTEPQELIEKDFNIYTDPYENKSFDWDSQRFE